MLQTTIQALHDGSVDATGYRLYVVKNSADVLYVGQSTNISKRLRGHISSRFGGFWQSPLGEAIYENKPHSKGWEVEIYTLDECSEIIKKWFPRAVIHSSEEMSSYAEDALTHQFNPLYNKRTNKMYPVDDSPFYKRLNREKEEAYRQHEIEIAREREHLVNSVCDICGEHDTWIDSAGALCGVKEDSNGFKLLCHNCDEVISLLNRLEKKADRVHKVKEAIRRTELEPGATDHLY